MIVTIESRNNPTTQLMTWKVSSNFDVYAINKTDGSYSESS
jgi:hypothetical protein